MTVGSAQVCAQAAENSPYTVEDINTLAAKWKDLQPPHLAAGEMTNLIHPYCRCRTMPWIQSRRLNVQFATTPPSPPVVLNVRQLGQAIATELGAILKVTPVMLGPDELQYLLTAVLRTHTGSSERLGAVKQVQDDCIKVIAASGRMARR